MQWREIRLPQVPLYNREEALELVEPSKADDNLSMLEQSGQTSHYDHLD